MQRSTLALLVSLLAAPALADPAPSSEAPTAIPQALPPTPVAPTPNPEAPAPSVRADSPVKIRDGEQGMRDGTFLPLTLGARIGDQRVMGMGLGGYDTTGSDQGGALFHSVVEGALLNRVALRAGVDYSAPDQKFAPSVGLRLGILRQERFGIDLGVAALYKNTGFSEPDGEVEMIVMVARRWNRLGLYGNVAYGQGIKPRERDGEVRVALLYQLARHFHLGFDARGRFDLGEGDRVDMPFDLVAGPVVGATVGKFGFLAQAGGRVAIVNDNAIGGFTALGGVGALY
jgi:hypothetical protein